MRLGAFIAGLPAASAPWQAAHLLCRGGAVVSPGQIGDQDEHGYRDYVITNITSFVVFMISFFSL
jgi:hypothetical protein